MTSHEAYLNKSTDWELFDEALRTFAVDHEVWQIADPEQTHELEDYHPGPRPTPGLYQRRLERETRSLSSTTATAGGTEAHSEHTDPSNKAQDIDELTPADLTRYNAKQSEWRSRNEEYQALRKGVAALRSWMQTRVNASFKTTCFRSTDTVREWYANLQMATAADQGRLLFEANEAYKEAIKAPTHIGYAGLEKWITRWEEVMAKAVREQVPSATQANIWLEDLYMALQQAAPLWVTVHRSTSGETMASNTLAWRTVAANFRLHIRGQKGLKGTLARGAFGATFNPGEEDDGDDAREGVPQRGRGRTRGGNRGSNWHAERGNNSRSRPREGGQPTTYQQTTSRKRAATHTTCICGMTHEVRKCWLLFPKLRPDDYRVNALMEKGIHAIIKEDRHAEDRYKAAKKLNDAEDNDLPHTKAPRRVRFTSHEGEDEN
jgi:hypothetical protein